MSDQLPGIVKKGSVSVVERLKFLDKVESFSILATQDTNTPYTSLVAYAITPDLKKLIFATTKDTHKYRNMINSKQVALLIDNRSSGNKNLIKLETLTCLGIARPVKRGNLWDEFARIFLNKHPDFEEFIKAPTTALMEVEIIRYIHVGEFQTVSTWEPMISNN
ncbi:MAG: pyridoxamine 5'-phosphate oxidase family protein [Proteobacteria bacterium]|nr:pyridoxamine 5'-phosphate oxidase family protein [Pseudomonadota bacterium]